MKTLFLTGKAKEDFDIWLLNWIKENIAFENETPIQEDINHFYKFPCSMQYGVYIDWFESIGINICITPVFPVEMYGYSFNIELKADYIVYTTRKKARSKAIENANITYNQMYENNKKT